jgi:glycosyltransferase involved in cell wall biosynthesis
MRHVVEAAGALSGPNVAAIEPAHLRALGQLEGRVLSERLSGAAVYVSTARYEPFGLGVLEAAQAGCALVLAGIPTLRELWTGAALFVDPTDDAALATILDRLLDDPARCAELGAAAAERAASYGLDAMVDGMMEIYREVLDRSAIDRGAAA